MRFINPKTDYAFKKIFGSEQSHDILISFLNAILYDGNDVIKDLEIRPYLAPKIRGIKATCLQVEARLENHTTIIIKTQVLNIEGFEKDFFYNIAKTYSTQVEVGQDYTLLDRVIALTITDFEMFPEMNQLISRFILKEKDFLIDYPIYDIELVFVELPKFHKEVNNLETLADKWLYFLKRARQLDVVPESMNLVPEIKKAFEVANEVNLTPEQIEDMEMQEMFIHDQRNTIKKALNQGRQEGLEEGKVAARIEMARKLLDVIDDEAISQASGLSLQEIAQLRA